MPRHCHLRCLKHLTEGVLLLPTPSLTSPEFPGRGIHLHAPWTLSLSRGWRCSRTHQLGPLRRNCRSTFFTTCRCAGLLEVFPIQRDPPAERSRRCREGF